MNNAGYTRRLRNRFERFRSGFNNGKTISQDQRNGCEQDECADSGTILAAQALTALRNRHDEDCGVVLKFAATELGNKVEQQSV
jgi:hypothetical protein